MTQGDDPFEEPLDMSDEGILARAVSSYSYMVSFAETLENVEISWLMDGKPIDAEQAMRLASFAFDEGYLAGFRAAGGHPRDAR